ncbi:cytochrome oxidase subunit III [marine bacterium AO1-C]|nr:cytochrome oxidase subunit III [marine bacterium AO1-C]
MATVATEDEKKKGIDWGGGNRPLGGVRYGKLMMWFFLLSDAFTFSALLISYGMIRFSHEAYSPDKEYVIEVNEGGYGINPKQHGPNNAIELSDDGKTTITKEEFEKRYEERVKAAKEKGKPAPAKGSNYYSSQKYWPIPEEVFDAVPFFHGLKAPLVFVGIMTFILIMSSVTMVLAVEAGHRGDQKDVEKWMLWTILGGITFLGSQAWEWTHFIVGTDYGGALRLSGDGRNLGEVLYGAGLSENQYGPTTFANLFFFITGFHGTHVLSGVIINIIIFYNTTMGIYGRKNDYEMVEKVGLYWHFVDLVWVFVFTFFYLV